MFFEDVLLYTQSKWR